VDEYYFTRSISLEAQLELANKKAWEMQQLVEEATNIVFTAGLTADNTDWYLRAQRALGKETK
jgi:hypothetical protein